MCKVFCIAGINPANVDKAWKFVKAISGPMSKHNNDGIGYAAITKDGELFGERWLTNSTAFKRPTEDTSNPMMQFADVLVEPINDIKFEYNSFGDIQPDKAVAIILHTRMATSPKGLINTHPFVIDKTALIHNGVIRNSDEFKLSTTCDSESILHAYLNNSVELDTDRFQKAANELKGYYACGVLDGSKEIPTLDIFRTTGARLHAAWINELDTYVFSTDDNDIKETASSLGFTLKPTTYSINDEKIIRVNAITGEKISVSSFKPNDQWTTYKHSGYKGYYNGGSNASTNPTTTQKKLIGQSTDTGVTNIVTYPFSKFRKNTVVSDALMQYFNSGSPRCVKLTEREIQEHISIHENLAKA